LASSDKDKAYVVNRLFSTRDFVEEMVAYLDFPVNLS